MNITLCQSLLFLVQIRMPFMNAYFRHEERDEDGTYVCINFLSSKGGRQQDRSWGYSAREFLPWHGQVCLDGLHAGWMDLRGFLCSKLSSFYCCNRISNFWKSNSRMTQSDFLSLYCSYISLLILRNYDWKD